MVCRRESRKVAVPLIKAFQKEVDHLTIRAKETETALIEICSQLTNLPVYRSGITLRPINLTDIQN
ncbi:hypothetical protein DICVIV_07495 [Dictyocaulus viviparus]|uniref:Cux N-terminal domain-containing protein n=1 Tax=Dictyocaulus viviparus TaxID=29172 RepID=A0A0D8XVN8_DICVI|nr:hypothetical protein DICVIV_07495 [Dictyocaulus viviparus]